MPSNVQRITSPGRGSPAECDKGRQCAKHERYSDLAVLAACGVEQRGEQHDQRQARRRENCQPVLADDQRHEHAQAAERLGQADEAHEGQWEYGRPRRLLGQLVDRAGAVLNSARMNSRPTMICTITTTIFIWLFLA